MSKFWFTKGSGRFEAGKQVMGLGMYNFSVPVGVKAVSQNARILVEWSAYGTPTLIEWFSRLDRYGTTLVSVTNKGFRGGEADVQQLEPFQAVPGRSILY